MTLTQYTIWAAYPRDGAVAQVEDHAGRMLIVQRRDGNPEMVVGPIDPDGPRTRESVVGYLDSLTDSQIYDARTDAMFIS